MKLVRFLAPDRTVRPGLLRDDGIVDLAAAGLASLTSVLEAASPAGRLAELLQPDLPVHPRASVRVLAPVEAQEIWAVGVTYLRSKSARMEESDFSARAYDRVYDAPRPELFFKSVAPKIVGPGEPVGIRADAKWSVPEPELALVLNSRGELAGFTIGNDMSSRDIEGENLLYLPQAKIYERSCALGPCVVIGADEAAARTWTIRITISREGREVFTGETPVDRIKRRFAELIEYLFRSQKFPQGAVLLTGTGIVPPNEFTLAAGDSVRIAISGIGELENIVAVV